MVTTHPPHPSGAQQYNSAMSCTRKSSNEFLRISSKQDCHGDVLELELMKCNTNRVGQNSFSTPSLRHFIKSLSIIFLLKYISAFTKKYKHNPVLFSVSANKVYSVVRN